MPRCPLLGSGGFRGFRGLRGLPGRSVVTGDSRVLQAVHRLSCVQHPVDLRRRIQPIGSKRPPAHPFRADPFHAASARHRATDFLAPPVRDAADEQPFKTSCPRSSSSARPRWSSSWMKSPHHTAWLDSALGRMPLRAHARTPFLHRRIPAPVPMSADVPDPDDLMFPYKRGRDRKW